MTIYLFLAPSILLNLGTTSNLVLDCELHSAPIYFITAAAILTISALPYPFLVGSYVVTVITIGEKFDASSRHCLEMPLFFPILYLCFGVLLSYPCPKMVTELHHSGFLFSMVIRLKRFVKTLPAIDITARQITCVYFCMVCHCKRFQISIKCQIQYNK